MSEESEGSVATNADFSLVEARERTLKDASQLVKELQAPRAPGTGGRHVSRRMHLEEQPQPNELDSTYKLENKLDRNSSSYYFYGTPEGSKRPSGKRVYESTAQYHFYGTPQATQNKLKVVVDNDDDFMALSVNTETKENVSGDDIVSPMDLPMRQWTPVAGNSDERLSSPYRPESGNRILRSGGSSRGSNRPVSREDVKKMEIPSFDALQRATSPAKVRASSPGPIVQLIIEEGELGEGDDDSSVTSLNSTDEAIIGELRRGLADAEQITADVPAPVQMPPPGQVDDPANGNLNMDLSEFDFATGGMMEGEGKTGPEEVAGHVGVPRVDSKCGPGFTDALLPGYPADPDGLILESDYK